MLKSITSVAGAAVILAALATTTVQAKQITTDAQKCEQVEAQKVAKAQSPYLWLVLGVGY